MPFLLSIKTAGIIQKELNCKQSRFQAKHHHHLSQVISLIILIVYGVWYISVTLKILQFACKENVASPMHWVHRTLKKAYIERGSTAKYWEG
jgi:hypothetical protein